MLLLQDGDGYITAAEIQELLGSDKCAQGIRGFGIVHRPGSTYYEGSSSSELHAYYSISNKIGYFLSYLHRFSLFSNLQTSKIWLQKPTQTGTVKLALEVSSKTKE